MKPSERSSPRPPGAAGSQPAIAVGSDGKRRPDEDATLAACALEEELSRAEQTGSRTVIDRVGYAERGGELERLEARLRRCRYAAPFLPASRRLHYKKESRLAGALKKT